jgi:hypothetical protein
MLLDLEVGPITFVQKLIIVLIFPRASLMVRIRYDLKKRMSFSWLLVSVEAE